MKARKPRPAAPPPRRRRRPLPSLRTLALGAVAAVFVLGCGGVVLLTRLPGGPALFARAAGLGMQATAALGLVVDDIEVEGRETTDTATIMAALAAERGTPILAIDPNRARDQLQALPWVRSAAIERRLPSTLLVRLVERHPLAVWQHGGKQELIDRDGSVIPVADLSRFARLPTVVGDDAADKAAPLLEMLAHEPDLAARVTAAVRVDNRRWNLRIDHAIDVLLPEEDTAAAWSRLAALERSESVLKRDIRTVDMRLPDRLVLRVNAAPASDPGAAKKTRTTGKNT